MSRELKSIDLSLMSREQLERLVLVQLRTIEELEERLASAEVVVEDWDV